MSAMSFGNTSINAVHVKKFLRTVQWLVPLSLFALATVYEFIEHHVVNGEPVTLNLSTEVLLFGVLGPGAVAGLIVYIRRLVEMQQLAQIQLKSLNRQLEQKVNDRTVALEQRNVDLARVNVELQHLDEMKSEFVALVSHELRAPLTTLNGAIELALQMDEVLPLPVRGTLEIMAAESGRLTDFIQTILDMSRLEAGKLSVNPGPVAVRPLMEEAIKIVLGQSNRHIEWNICNNLPPVWADEVLLEQVIRNLVRNADKYSPRDKPIHMSACLAGVNQVSIRVRDHGLGIAPELKERIFDRFVRGQRGESAPVGWGLGLYLARKLVEAQQGQVGVDSPMSDDPNAPGSEFYILLPIAPAPEEE